MRKNHIVFWLAGVLCLALLLLINLDGLFKLLLLVSLAIFAIATLKPKLGLSLLIIARPCLDIFADRPVVIAQNISLNLASLFAISAILFSAVILIKKIPKIKTLPLKYNWLTFTLIAGGSIFFSYSGHSTLAESLRLLSILAIYCLAFLLVESTADLKNLLKAVIVSAIIPSFFALWQLYTTTGLTVPLEGIYDRIYGTFAHPNLFAYYLLLPLTLSLYFFLNGNKKTVNNLLYLLTAIFLLVLLTLTFTRGAWLAFLIVMMMLGLFRYRALLLVTMIFLALSYFSIESINYRVNDLVSGRSDSSIEWRLDLWRDAKEYVNDRVWLGHGAGVAASLILDKRGERFGSSDPHNDYLKIAIENGLLGLMTYAALIAGLFVNLIKNYRLAGGTEFQALILATIGLASALYIMSAVDNILRNTALQWSFWALVGGILSINYLQPKSAK